MFFSGETLKAWIHQCLLCAPISRVQVYPVPHISGLFCHTSRLHVTQVSRPWRTAAFDSGSMGWICFELYPLSLWSCLVAQVTHLICCWCVFDSKAGLQTRVPFQDNSEKCAVIFSVFCVSRFSWAPLVILYILVSLPTVPAVFSCRSACRALLTNCVSPPLVSVWAVWNNVHGLKQMGVPDNMNMLKYE